MASRSRVQMIVGERSGKFAQFSETRANRLMGHPKFLSIQIT